MHEKFDSYSKRFATIRITRQDGIVVMRLHSNEGPLHWGLTPHAELSHAYRAVGADPENRCIVLTGTGEWFAGPRAMGDQGSWTANPPVYSWEFAFDDARRMNFDMLEVPIPMIAAVNGPCYRHGNMALMCDMVIAADTASWEDKAHFSEQNLVPGDGVHVIYPFLMGLNRARYFLLTGQVIGAAEALQMGLINEVLPPDQVLPRALELAKYLADKPAMLVRATRALLLQTLKREMLASFGMGATSEGYIGKALPDRVELDPVRHGIDVSKWPLLD